MPDPILVVVDIQERLFAVMDAERRDEMIGNIRILGAATRRLGVQRVITEQYPKGLGHTLPELRALFDDVTPLEKTAVCSRRRESLELGLAQARQAGAVVTSTETIVFRLLERADTEDFRVISKLLR